MELRPDNSWPDVVYYHSYTHPGMGWKINIVDRFSSLNQAGGPGFGAFSAASLISTAAPVSAAATTLVVVLVASSLLVAFRP